MKCWTQVVICQMELSRRDLVRGRRAAYLEGRCGRLWAELKYVTNVSRLLRSYVARKQWLIVILLIFGIS